MVALGNRVHIYARPKVKAELNRFFTTVLGCGEPQSLEAPGVSEPILAWNFPSGGSLSVEFTEEALDEIQALRGAWLELRANDPSALRKQILEAGVARIEYLGNEYFAIPGGQVLRVVQAA